MNKYLITGFLILFQTATLQAMHQPANLRIEHEEMLTIHVGELEDAYGNKMQEYRNIPQRIMQDYLALVAAANGPGTEENLQFVREIAQKKYTNNETLLHHASLLGGVEIALVLIDFGADVSAEDHIGHRPLHYAVENRKIEHVKLLIERGADMEAKDHRGQTPVQLALRRGHDNITRAGYVPIIEVMSAVITYRGGEFKHLKSLRPAWQYKKCKLAAKVGKNIALRFMRQPCDLKDIDQRKYNEITQFLATLPEVNARPTARITRSLSL